MCEKTCKKVQEKCIVVTGSAMQNVQSEIFINTLEKPRGFIYNRKYITKK